MDTQGIIKELEAHAAQLEDELNRTRAAIEAFNGGVPRATRTRAMSQGAVRPSAQAPRGETLRRILGTLDTHGAMGYRELTDAMLGEGWETTSETPANTVRTALGRMQDRGQVIRLDDGRFALPEHVEENESGE